MIKEAIEKGENINNLPCETDKAIEAVEAITEIPYADEQGNSEKYQPVIDNDENRFSDENPHELTRE